MFEDDFDWSLDETVRVYGILIHEVCSSARWGLLKDHRSRRRWGGSSFDRWARSSDESSLMASCVLPQRRSALRHRDRFQDLQVLELENRDKLELEGCL